MNNETASEIEIRIANYFDYVKYVIVPNISHGFSQFTSRELDLMLLNNNGYAYEVEIKVSKQDLINDKKKWHNHQSSILRKLWFAIPEKLEKDINLIPEEAGILIVDKKGNVTEIRKSKTNLQARKFTEKEKFRLARLGAMRIWRLKSRLVLNEH